MVKPDAYLEDGVSRYFQKLCLIVHYMVSTCYSVTTFYVQHMYGMHMPMGNFHI